MGRKAPFQGKDGKLLIGLQLAGLLNLLHYFPLLYELWLLWRYKYANTDIYVHMLQNKDAFIRPMYHWMEVTLNNTYLGMIQRSVEDYILTDALNGTYTLIHVRENRKKSNYTN